MKKILLMLFVFSLVFIFSTNAFAYLDPGTGGVIIGSIWPLIVALFSAIGAFIIKWFWKPIKRAFSRILRRKTD